jgi:hypothetical protein
MIEVALKREILSKEDKILLKKKMKQIYLPMTNDRKKIQIYSLIFKNAINKYLKKKKNKINFGKKIKNIIKIIFYLILQSTFLRDF